MICNCIKKKKNFKYIGKVFKDNNNELWQIIRDKNNKIISVQYRDKPGKKENIKLNVFERINNEYNK